MLQEKLKNIVKLDVGLAFRSRIENSLNGDISVIQMKDLKEDSLLDYDKLLKINKNKIKKQYFVKKGDLIMKSRGFNNNVTLINQDCVNTIVSAPLFILRITSTKVLPEYLFFYLNQQSIQHQLSKNAQGSSIAMITREDIGNLIVKIPNLQKQKLIGKLTSVIKQERIILDKIKEKREFYIKNIIQQQLLIK